MNSLEPAHSHSLPPQDIIDSYPLLRDGAIEYIGELFPPVPISPDKSYRLYKDHHTGSLLTHVETDHPDPVRDSQELYAISKLYTFTDIVLPYSEKNERTKILNNDSMNDDFFIKKDNTYHYLASTIARH